MSIKEFLKPSMLRIFIFLFISFFYLYVVNEGICAVGFFFKFCYNAYGFPFQYLITGEIGKGYAQIKTLFLGNYFTKFGNFLLNPVTIVFDIVLIYLLSCLMSMLFKN